MAQEQPRGATLRLRSGEAAERSYPASEVIGGWEQLPRIQVQGRQPGGDTPCPRSGAGRRSHLTPEARGGDPEEPPRAQGQGWRPGGATQGAVAAQAQEGLEELSHLEGQEPQR